MKYNGNIKRFAAFILDYFLFSTILLITNIVSLSLLANGKIDFLEYINNGVIITSIATVTDLIYHTVFVKYFNSQTIGKRILNLKIVNKNNKNPSLLTLIVRRITFIISIIAFFPIILLVVFTEKKQGLHDLIAGTFVIELEKKEKLSKINIISIVLFLLLLLIQIITTVFLINSAVTSQNPLSDNTVNTNVNSPVTELIKQEYIPEGWAFITLPEHQNIINQVDNKPKYNFDLCTDEFYAQGETCLYFKDYYLYAVGNQNQTEVVTISIGETKDNQSANDFENLFLAMNANTAEETCNTNLLKSPDSKYYYVINRRTGESNEAFNIVNKIKEENKLISVITCTPE